MNRSRALLPRWSKRPNNHLALMQLAAGLIAFKKAQTHDWSPTYRARPLRSSFTMT